MGDGPRHLMAGSILANLEPVECITGDSSGNQGMQLAAGVAHNADHLPAHLAEMFTHNRDMSQDQKRQLGALLAQYQQCFEGGQYGLGKTNMVTHKIDTGSHKPIKLPPRCLGWAQKRALDSEVEKMLNLDVIEPSCSPWSSPPLLVKKKDNTFRFCVDYRKLNSLTKKAAYPLPRTDECLDALSGSQWFCTLDLGR